MRISRLVIESDQQKFTLDLHRRCTVIAGLSSDENEAMISELTSALGPGRAGVHLEFTEDDGAAFAVFRPHTSHHRVVHVERSADVTARYRRRDGSVDLLHARGTDVLAARDHLVLAPAHLPHREATDPVIRRLASLDQAALRASLRDLEAAEANLAKLAEAEDARKDTEAVDRVEEVHAELERYQQKHERARRFSFYTGVFAAVASFLVILGGGPVLAALPLVALAVGVSVFSILQWRQVEEARDIEDEALDAAGAQSYLGLHIERVNSLISSTQRRSEMLIADEKHRLALEDWKRLVGDIPVRWVLEHGYEIAEAATLRQELIDDGALAMKDGVVDDSGLLFLRSLRSWILAADGVGDDGGLPIICNDPFRDLDPGAKPVLLEELNRSAGDHQVVFLTSDPDVVSWAAAEAVTGQIALLEQSRTTDSSVTGERKPTMGERAKQIIHRGRAAAGHEG